MDGQVASAPVLSTPDNHILTEIEPIKHAEPSSSLTEEQFEIRYEIDRTIKEIRAQGWKRIALQFPDHMLNHSARVVQLLSRGLAGRSRPLTRAPETTEITDLRIASLSLDSDIQPVRLTILADTSYGSCCIDEIAAEHVEAEAVIHYGRACLSPTARLPVLHIFTYNELNQAAAIEAFLDAFPTRGAKVILTADIPYASHVHGVTESLSRLGYTTVFAADIVRNPSSLVPNRTVPQEILDHPERLSEWHIYHIHEPPTALLLNLSSKVRSIRIFTPELASATNNAQAQEVNTSMVLRRRYALVTSMNTVSTWGILINTLSVKNYLHVVDHVKNQIAEAGKKSYLFVVGKLNAAKVANFSEIGGWVVIGCWESSLIDSRDFFKPILTPFELELALATDESRVWTGAWQSDFEGVLDYAQSHGEFKVVSGNGDGKEDDGHKDERDMHSDEESEPPEFDLRTGRYVSQSRPMSRPEAMNRRVEANGQKDSNALTRRMNGEIVGVNGVASPAAEFLAQKRTWKGLGSDFQVKYDDEEEEGSLIEEGRSGVARGYAVGSSTKT